MVDVNIKGVLYGIAAALPRMREQHDGQIINLSSVAGHVVPPNSAVYSGTKFAVWAISEGLRQEVGDEIRTTTISPGAQLSCGRETFRQCLFKTCVRCVAERDPEYLRRSVEWSSKRTKSLPLVITTAPASLAARKKRATAPDKEKSARLSRRSSSDDWVV